MFIIPFGALNWIIKSSFYLFFKNFLLSTAKRKWKGRVRTPSIIIKTVTRAQSVSASQLGGALMQATYTGADRLLLLLMLRKLNGRIFISTKGMENSCPFQWYQLIPCKDKQEWFWERCVRRTRLKDCGGGVMFHFKTSTLCNVSQACP